MRKFQFGGGGCYSGLKPKLSKSSMRSYNPGGGGGYYSEPSSVTGCYTWFWSKNSGIIACSCIAGSLSHTTCVETNKAAHCSFETQRRRHQKSKTGVSVAPQKDLSPPKIFKKNWQKMSDRKVETYKVSFLGETLLIDWLFAPLIHISLSLIPKNEK